MSDELSPILRARREKLDRLREREVEPFAYRFDRSETSGSTRTAFEAAEAGGELPEDGHGAVARVGGRVVSWRGHGKSAFAHIEDGDGRIQLYFKKNVLGDESFDLALEMLDLGDWIGVAGPTFRTRTGEVTIRVDEWQLLTKSLRPLPFGKVEVDAETGERVVHSGFADTESRYRQRYADLAVNPEVRDVFRTRAHIVRELRQAAVAFVVLALIALVAGWLIHEQFSSQKELLGLALGISASACLGFPFASGVARRLLRSEQREGGRARQLLAALGSTLLNLVFLAAGAYIAIYYLNEHYLTSFGA